jgi:shikimate kinase
LTTAEDEEFAMPRQGYRVVVLVGFMGAGKTSVGKMLAEQLHWRFVDLDDLVVARERSSIAKIFEEAGESGFRSRESAALHQLLSEVKSSGDAVVALGGGALSQPENRAALEQSGFHKIFLDAPVELLFQRCASPSLQRPLLKDLSTFRNLYLSRQRQYSSAAVRVETGNKSVAEVCDEIRSLIEARTLGMKEND